jgi:hypothetical protein
MLFISLILSGQTTYYTGGGSDASGNGSITRPWATLHHACDTITQSGNTIYVNAGTCTETEQSTLAEGVNINGAGATSIIHSHLTGDDYFSERSTSVTILLSSTNEGTNGNQYITNIKMEGSSLGAHTAIAIIKRGGVEISNCTFVDFNYNGVIFDGDGSMTQPGNYATGNIFHNNNVTNCSGYFSGEGQGALRLNGQQTMLIYNNTLDQTSREAGSNGYLIKCVNGYIKDIKIYNNIINRVAHDGVGWNFSIELWYGKGGIEIYDNIITNGSIDVCRFERGVYSYSIWIHDNLLGNAVIDDNETAGIIIEADVSDVVIERNYIKNVGMGIYFSYSDIGGKTVSNYRISYNIFDNIGQNADWKGWGIRWDLNTRIGISNNFNIYNNVFSGTIEHITMRGITLPDLGTATNVSVRNNIVQGFDECPIYANGDGGTTIDVLSIENNIFYNNGNSNAPSYVNGMSPTNNTTQNNITSDPLFVSTSDFHITSGSPAKDTGLNVGLTKDYSNHSVPRGAGYDIGAYEYGTYYLKLGNKLMTSGGKLVSITY